MPDIPYQAPLSHQFPDWDINKARKAITTCFPQIKIQKLKPIYGGWDNFILEVNENLIFRFPRRPDAEKMLEGEIRILPLLRRALPIEVPNMTYVWHGSRSFSTKFVGYPRINGVELSSNIIKSHPATIAKQVATLLNALHRLSTRRAQTAGRTRATPNSWRKEHKLLFERVRNEIFPLFEETVQQRTSQLFGEFLGNDSNFDFEPCLIHRDLNTNILCYPSTGALTGVLDWGDSCIGDPTMDFCGFLYANGRAFVERIVRNYECPLGRSFWQRMAFYAMLIPYKVAIGAVITKRPFRIKGANVILGKGRRVSVFEMFKSSAALSNRIL